ncbi:MAG: hypothetical protein E7642_08740 [Ruminococcaceae bacterium]|nr:hypothetical protein [Oscillospiraceae bacterium]
MKKKLVILFALIVAALLFCTSCFVETVQTLNESDSEKVTEAEPTDLPTEKPTEKSTEKIVSYEEIEDTIRTKYFEKFGARMSHAKTSAELELQFLGQFGNSIAIHVLEDEYHLLLSYPLFSHTVEGYEFRFEDVRKVYIYDDGKFLPLEEALGGYITAEDLATIHAEFKRLNPLLYKNTFDEEILSIKQLNPSFISIKVQPQYNNKDYTAEDFSEIPLIEFRDYGKKDDLSQIYARYQIWLDENITMEEAIAICRILEERDDIYEVTFSGWQLD